MRQYNYKCIVTKNGMKMYYKRVSGKWKRISNKVGMKAEKGKRKYEKNKKNKKNIKNIITNNPSYKLCEDLTLNKSFYPNVKPAQIRAKRNLIYGKIKEFINEKSKDGVKGIKFLLNEDDDYIPKQDFDETEHGKEILEEMFNLYDKYFF